MKYLIHPIVSITTFIETHKPYVPPFSEDFEFLSKNQLDQSNIAAEVILFDITKEMGMMHSQTVVNFFLEKGFRPCSYAELLGLLQQHPDIWNEYFAISALGTFFNHIDGPAILSAGNHPKDGKYLMLSQFDVCWFPSSNTTKRGFVCINTKDGLKEKKV